MKRIKIITADATLLAKPLGLAQLTKMEKTITGILAESAEIGKTGAAFFPVALLKKQADIVLTARKNHDPSVTAAAVDEMSILEISMAFASVLSGDGMEEIEG